MAPNELSNKQYDKRREVNVLLHFDNALPPFISKSSSSVTAFISPNWSEMPPKFNRGSKNRLDWMTDFWQVSQVLWIEYRKYLELTTYLFVQFDKGWLKKLVQIRSLVVWVLHMTQTLAHVVLFRQEDLFNLLWKGVEGNINIFCISDLF